MLLIHYEYATHTFVKAYSQEAGLKVVRIRSFFSSTEHEVLMVSYCGQWLSVVRRHASCDVRRATCVVRRPSTFDVYTLETTFVT